LEKFTDSFVRNCPTYQTGQNPPSEIWLGDTFKLTNSYVWKIHFEHFLKIHYCSSLPETISETDYANLADCLISFGELS